MTSKKNADHSALDLARRYAHGGRVGYAEGGEPKGSLSSLYEPMESWSTTAHKFIDDSIPEEINNRPHAYPLLGHLALGLGLDTPASLARVASKGIDYLRGQPDATQVDPGDYAQAAFMGLPYVGPAIRTAAHYAAKPLAAAAVGATALMPSDAAPADAAHGDPRKVEIAKWQNEIARLNADMQKQMKELPTKSARDNMGAAIQKQIDAAQKRIDNINSTLGSEDTRKVDEAVAARDAILRDAPRPFDKALPWLAEAMPFVPAVLGGATGFLLSRHASKGASEGAQLWRDAVNKATTTTSPTIRDRAIATARGYGEQFPAQGIGDKLAGYALPAGLGSLEGALIPNITEGYNMLRLPAENPERRAMEEYAKGLPEGHPDVERTRSMLANEDVLPKTSPAKDAARRYFSDFFGQMLPRMGAGAGEGAASAMLGHTLGSLYGPAEKTLPRPQTDALADELRVRGPLPSLQRTLEPTRLESTTRASELPSSQQTNRLLPKPTLAEDMLPIAPEATVSASDTPIVKPLIIKQSDAGYHWPKDTPGGKGGKFMRGDIAEGRVAPDDVKPSKKASKAKSPKDKDIAPTGANGKGNGKTTAEDFDESYPSDPTKKPPKPPGGDFGFRSGGAVLDLARQYASGGTIRDAEESPLGAGSDPASSPWADALATAAKYAPLLGMLALRSKAGSMIGRDSVMANRMERKALEAWEKNPNQNAQFDLGITGGSHNFGQGPYPHSQSASGLINNRVTSTAIESDPFRSGIATDEIPFWLKQTPANEVRDFNVIPGGKKANGGSVAAYAHGGPVAGPILGHTGGREDAKPVDVASGSFVIPADIVSGIGTGNTLSGMRQLEAQFGKPMVRRAAGGSAQNVPIAISDGEFVVTPEQVAKVGGGDINRGHAILDKLVLALRKQHVKTLSTLPGPARN